MQNEKPSVGVCGYFMELHALKLSSEAFARLQVFWNDKIFKEQL